MCTPYRYVIAEGAQIDGVGLHGVHEVSQQDAILQLGQQIRACDAADSAAPV